MSILSALRSALASRAASARQMPLALLVGGLVVAGLYYDVAVQYGSGGHPAASQPDALMYMQYARAWAEGHPYAFAAGEAPSTGSTSHLYPAVLAIPYLLGAHGDALLAAAFVINALCYLLWLQLFWLVARRCAPRQAALAAALALGNGYVAMVAMDQSDIALFMALSWGALTALVYGRTRLAAAILALSVFARPEGMILAVSLACLGVVARARHPSSVQARRGLRAGIAGLLAVAAVFVLNRVLTGTCQFQSVAQKGYLTLYPLAGALGCASHDFALLVREVLFNLGAAPRQSYFLPVAGGLLACAGLASVRWATSSGRWLAWWSCGCLGALGVVCLSDWQGVATDRYLGWSLPVWFLFAAVGASTCAARLRRPGAMVVLAVLLLGYEAATWPYFVSRYAGQCAQTQARVAFAKTVNEILPADASLGMLGGTGMMYYLGQRPMRHLAGITSPSFGGQRDPLCALEALKHNPGRRFDFWLVTTGQRDGWASLGLTGKTVLDDQDAPPGDDAYGVQASRWDRLPADCLLPLDPAVTNRTAGWTLVDRLDVGYTADEQRCAYRAFSRLADETFHPFAVQRALAGRLFDEVGQPVIGWDRFRVRAPQTGQPLYIVLRTALDATCTVTRTSAAYPGEGIHLCTPLRLRLSVNGAPLPEVSIPLACAPDAFAECVLEVPGTAVTSDPLELEVAGDHLAMAYWFYQ